MKKKGGDIFRTVLGCYLIFLGVCLWIEVSGKKPSDEQLMTVIALLMIIIGLVYAAFSLSRITGFPFRLKKDKQSQTEEKELQAENSAGIRQKKHIMKNVELINIPSEDADRKKDEKTESNAASKDLNNGKAYACKETKVIGSIEDIRKIHESEQKGESGKAQPESDKAEDETSLKDKKEETRSETENIETTDEQKKAEKEETEKAEEIEKDYEEK